MYSRPISAAGALSAERLGYRRSIGYAPSLGEAMMQPDLLSSTPARATAGAAPRASAPPSARGFPLVGVLPHLLKDRLDYLVSAREQLGDLYTIDLGLARIVALNHPRHAQHVLRDNARNYSKGGALWESIRALIGNGLPTSEGDLWLRQRRMIQPEFHRDRLAAMCDLMVQAIDDGMAGFGVAAAAGRPVNAERELPHITMKVILNTMFGSGITKEEADAVGGSMKYAIDYMLLGAALRALPGWMPAPGRRRFERSVKTIDENVFRFIAQRRAQPGRGGDLLSILLATVDAETGEQMSNQQLRDEAVSMFLAGYETTSVTLAWALHFLVENPDLLQALAAEVDAALGDRRPGFADVPRLPLALAVVQEALRIYPPAYWIPRTAVEDDEIDGFHIPAGTLVGIMSYVLHRHPDHWEAPMRFDPGRFTPERARARHPLAFIPFGIGQRQCIGKEFALMEGQLILARLLQRYRVSAVPGRTTRLHVATTLRTSGGVWLRLEPRAGR
ncbi:cytochrome P450 [Sorangium sp. So ce295]|uniref:cytochrome P450 n=1 Tax=Sorangium sp. So ce295 TaxID=3133295 RepID=UPI003F5F0A26